MMTHTEENPYQCGHCDEAFKIYIISQNIRLHTLERNYIYTTNVTNL